jgi:iduronate 2-sulfatase
MNPFRRFAILLAGLVLALPGALAAPPPNVVFITVDDLRPALGCYGESQVITPHLDRLASRGIVFRRVYAQQAICNASRASFLTGLRPDSTGVFDLVTHFRKRVPDVVTLPQHFKNRGYRTLGFGKIYHPAFPGFGIGSELHDEPSWSEPVWMPGPRYYYSPLGIRLSREIYQSALRTKQTTAATNWMKEALARLAAHPDEPESEDDWTKVNVRILATEAPDVPDGTLYDGQVTDRSVAALRRLKADQGNGAASPFFLAVGYLKPHLPFVAPRKYWDLYDPAKLAVADNPAPPRDVPAAAMAVPMDELRGSYPKDVRVPAPGQPDEPPAQPYDLLRGRPLTREQQIQLRRGYYACISYVDAQIGRVLAELERLDLTRHTIVVVVGDHGFHLGDHGLWGKLTNFEAATRVPMIISAPHRAAGGHQTDALVELVDVYPTLCELANLPLPKHLEGVSAAPLFTAPTRAWKRAAFSQYPRPGLMGYSMRTDRYRFTRWQVEKNPAEVAGLELYDHVSDPGESVNLAFQPAYANLIAELTADLQAGWPAARPASARVIK